MPAKRPNILWIFGDQHRGQALSCAGDPNVSTPEIDRLAAEGVHFTRAVAGMPLCCAFRGSLLTGQYPHRCVPGHEFPLPQGMPTIAQPFREAGYDTAYIGKWHLDGWKEKDGRAALHIVPRECRGGFDTWIGYENNNSQWDCWVHGHRAGGGEVDLYRLPGYETDELTNLLISYLNEKAAGDGQPFFAALSVQPPHDPYLSPARFAARHTPASLRLRPNVPDIPRVQTQARRELAGAYGQIENLDWNLGRIREALAATGLADNTYIVFFSDHGDMHGSHGQFRKMTPYEESIRVPFILSGPPSMYAGAHRDPLAVVNHVDILPTTLGLAGIPTPAGLPGHDYSSVYLRGGGPKEAPDSAFIQSVVPTGHGNSVDRPWRGVVTRDGWKYVVMPHQPWLLFNLNEDPYEQANLAFNSLFRAKRLELHQRLSRWITETGDTFDLPEESL